jgi:hypothetical protein
MAIDAMKDTRRKGTSKRLESISAMVKEAGDPMTLSIGRQTILVNRVVSNATGLNTDKSKDTFWSECELVLDSNVAPYFEDVLQLSEKMWNERKIEIHSKYHLVMKICMMMKGRKLYPPMSFSYIEQYYAKYEALAW